MKIPQKNTYVDENGYVRTIGVFSHSNLLHRRIAYEKIFIPHQQRYFKQFKELDVHHRDGDKLNNHISNLQILTKEEHKEIHGEKYIGPEFNKLRNNGQEGSGKEPIKGKERRTIVILLIVLILLVVGGIIYGAYQNNISDGDEEIQQTITEITQQTPSQYTCSYDAYNCDAFSTKAEAQSVFEMCGGVDNDIHYLDGDDDGLACESLP